MKTFPRQALRQKVVAAAQLQTAHYDRASLTARLRFLRFH
jgi:hypothetical protein